MVDIIVHKFLEGFSKKLNINLLEYSNKAHNLSINAGFNPPSKFVLNTCPDITVCYDGYDGVPNIILDLYKLIDDDPNLREADIIYDLTHELSHHSIGTTDFFDMVNYSIFKGRNVHETSNQEFRDKIDNLFDNTFVDPKLCMSNEFLLKSYYKSNYMNFNNNKATIKILRYLRNKNGLFPINLDTFDLMIRVIHPAIVSKSLKLNGFVSGKYKAIATNFDDLYHNKLKGAIGNDIINNNLDSIYKQLLNRILDMPYSKKRIYASARLIWNEMEELRNN